MELHAGQVRALRREHLDRYTAATREARSRSEKRLQAARAALLASAARGKDASKLDDAERTRLRGQALNWLTVRLAGKVKLAESTAQRSVWQW